GHRLSRTGIDECLESFISERAIFTVWVPFGRMLSAGTASGQQMVFDGASNRSPRLLVMKALRQNVAGLAFNPLGIFRRTGCASADVATGRGVLSLCSYGAVPAGVTALRPPRLLGCCDMHYR